MEQINVSLGIPMAWKDNPDGFVDFVVMQLRGLSYDVRVVTVEEIR